MKIVKGHKHDVVEIDVIRKNEQFDSLGVMPK